ncbi:MAG: recombinase family protein [Pleurocapsa sp. SU_196_0]|nr:recombinase family protein [Pleurocapsa sp. SU_196_0]
MTIAIGVTRVSTRPQDEGYGRDSQIADVTAHAARVGATITPEFWLHETQSGADDVADREVITHLLEMVTNHRGALVFFPRADRVARLQENVTAIPRALQRAGAITHVVGIPGEPYSENWYMMLGILATMAERDYRTIVRNLTDGKLRKHESGGWAQGKAPFGYRIKRDERGVGVGLEIIEAEARIIRDAYTLGLEMGSVAVSLELFKRHGVRWSTPRIQGIWETPTYRGERVVTIHGRPVSQPVPAIVDADTWNRTHERWKGRKRHRTGSRADKLLAGFLRCAECGSSLCASKVVRREDATYTYYRCVYGTKTAHHNRRGCTHRTNHSGRTLEPAAWALFAETIANPDTLAPLMQQPVANPIADLEVKRMELESELARAGNHFGAA